MRTVGLALLLSAVGCAAFAEQALLFTNATIIDGTGRAPLAGGSILVRDGKIAAVGKAAEVAAPPDGARRIDASGKFIIPGLIDANVHLVMNMQIEYHARYEDRYPELIEEAAQVTLKAGVTTVFDSWGPLDALKTVRDRVRRGEVIGSRIYVAGNIVGLSGPLGPDFNPYAATAASPTFVKRINRLFEQGAGPELLYRTPDQVRAAMRTYIAQGVDFVKYAAAGHGRGRSSFLLFSPESQRAIVEEAHRAGIIAQAHAMTVESLRQAIEAGADMAQHTDITGPEPMPEELIRLMLARKFHAAVQPFTARRLKMMIEDAPDQDEADLFRVANENIIRLIKSGVPLLLATDGGLRNPDEIAHQKPRLAIDRPYTLDQGAYLWFRAMVANGMSPMDAIVAATRNVAAAYRKLDEFGTLEKGKSADLVVLDADPLRDIENVRKITMVIQQGRIIDRDSLPVRKILTRPR